MKKQLRSDITLCQVRNKIAAAAFIFASSVAIAQAQTAEAPSSAEKQTTPEGQIEKVAPIDSQKKEDTTSMVSQPEIWTESATAARGETAKNPFSANSSAIPVKLPKQSSFASGWE